MAKVTKSKNETIKCRKLQCNKVSAIIVLVGVAILILFLTIPFGKDDTLVAKSKYGRVGTDEISTYLDKIEKLTGNKIDINKVTEEQLTFIVKDIVVQRKILKDAKASPVSSSKEFKDAMKNAKENILKTEYLKYIAEKSVNENALRAEYKEFEKQFEGKKEYKVKHILVQTKEEARSVLKMFYSKSFEEIAKEISIDKNSAVNGGELGYLLPDNLDQDFGKALVKQPIDKVSNPIQTRYGWHIIKVEEIRDATPTPYEEVKDSLKQQAISKFAREYMQEAAKDENLDIKLIKQIK
jgi:peptidyl-prolyl cis-trans isomerase C